MNSYQCFEKYKNVVFNEIMKDFGFNNQEYIKNVFSNFKLLLDVPPKEAFLNYLNRIDGDNILMGLQKYYEYLQFEYHKKKVFNKHIKHVLDEWINCFIDLNGQKDYGKIYRLFYDFDSKMCLIDFFKSDCNCEENLAIYRNYFTSIIKRYNYKIKTLDSKCVDLFVKWRDLYVREVVVKYLLLERNLYISRITSIINDSDYSIINDIINHQNPTCFKYIKNNGKDYRFVYFPLNRLKRNGNQTIDVILIHEMIHYLQDFWGHEVILNEVLVQKKAIKIVEKLHKKGIFIFDHEDKFKYSGECVYEVLNPFVDKVMEYVSDDLLNRLIITEDYHSLIGLFGEKFNEYIMILDYLYRDFCSNNSFNMENVKKCEECIRVMINYYIKHNKCKILKK